MEKDEVTLRAELSDLEATLAKLDGNWAAERDALLQKYQVVGKGKPKQEHGMRLAVLGFVLLIATGIIFFVFETFFWFFIPIGLLFLAAGYWEFSSALRFENAFTQYEEERQITADSLSQIQTQLGITPKWSKRARVDRAKNS